MLPGYNAKSCFQGMDAHAAFMHLTLPLAGFTPASSDGGKISSITTVPS